MATSHASWLLLLGLAGVACYNWRLFQRDKALLRQTASSAPLPDLESWPSRPKVSVLVAAWNEAERIESHIRSFLSLDYPDKELILCAGGADRTYALAGRWKAPNVKVLKQRPGEGKQRALQRCLADSSGAVIYLTDADCLFSDEALLRLIKPIAWGTAQVCTGVSQPKPHQLLNSLVQYQWFNDVLWSYQLPRVVDGVLGRNCALNRSVLDRVGGFDASVRTGTDYFLSRLLARAGYQIRAVPDSRIATEYPDSPQSYLRMWRRWNKNILLHGLRFGAWKDVKGVLVASMLYSVMLLMPVLALVLGPLAWVISALLFSMANANRLRRLSSGARLAGAGVTWRFLMRLPFYTCLDMVAVFLAIRDSLDPRARHRW